MNYTSIPQILTDIDLFNTINAGAPFNLGQLPAVASNRWQWLVDNWNVYSPVLQEIAVPSDTQTQAYEDLSRNVLSYQLGSNINPLQNINFFYEVSALLSVIELPSLTLTPQERVLVASEQSRIEALTIDDFRNMRVFLRKRSAIGASQIGLGDQIADTLVGVTPVAQQRSATVDDVVNLSYISDLIAFVEGVIINFKDAVQRSPDLLAFSNQNISPDSPVVINDTYLSSVALPFEISLDHMAQKYLGDSQLFYELVTVNKLQPPYVDMVGTKWPLLAPGALNNVAIASTPVDSVPVGTKIAIGSYKLREESRIVEKVVANGTNLTLYLSGAQDLAKLKTSEGAYVRIYAPNTVNQGSFILIPLTIAAATAGPYTPDNGQLRQLDAALLAFGVDWLRDEKTGAYVVDANGNFAYAAGLANVRQAVLFALRTTQGELPFHPNYGITSQIGEQYYGTIDEAAVFTNALRTTLLRDARFTNIQVTNLSATNTGISIGLLVQIAGLSQAIPLSYVS